MKSGKNLNIGILTNPLGDAISIREALYFKVPSVASNVVRRPKGTVLFKTRNLDNFILKVKDLLRNYEQHKQNLEEIDIEDNFGKIMDVYQKVISYSGEHYEG